MKEQLKPIWQGSIVYKTTKAYQGNKKMKTEEAAKILFDICLEAEFTALALAGFSEYNIGGSGLALQDVDVHIPKPICHGELMTLTMQVEQANDSTILMKYFFSSAFSRNLAYIETKMICIDYNRHKCTQVPAGFLQKMTA